MQANISLRHLGTSFLPVIEKAIVLLEDKATHLGTSIHMYCFISAAYALTRTKKDDQTGATHADPAEEAVERLSRLCYKLLALQEEPSAATSSSHVAKVC